MTSVARSIPECRTVSTLAPCEGVGAVQGTSPVSSVGSLVDGTRRGGRLFQRYRPDAASRFGVIEGLDRLAVGAVVTLDAEKPALSTSDEEHAGFASVEDEPSRAFAAKLVADELGRHAAFLVGGVSIYAFGGYVGGEDSVLDGRHGGLSVGVDVVKVADRPLLCQGPTEWANHKPRQSAKALPKKEQS